MKTDKEKKEIILLWYKEGIEAGFTQKQLDFLKNYFAFWNDVPKQLGDLI